MKDSFFPPRDKVGFPRRFFVVQPGIFGGPGLHQTRGAWNQNKAFVGFGEIQKRVSEVGEVPEHDGRSLRRAVRFRKGVAEAEGLQLGLTLLLLIGLLGIFKKKSNEEHAGLYADRLSSAKNKL